MEKNKVCILLTACVNPNGMSFTALQDAEERKRQYETALNFYLRETKVPIIFIENSGCNFKEVYADDIKRGRLECHTFQGNDYDKSLGKGYGEAKIVLYAAEHSKQYRESNYVIKITGRLIIRNINEIINSSCLELEDVVMLDFQPNVNILTTCIVLRPQLLADICREGLPRLNDTEGVFFEHVMYDGLCKRKSAIVPFAQTPIIEGICGSSLQPYNEGLNADKTPTNMEFLAFYYEKTGRLADAQIIKNFRNYLTTQTTQLNGQINERQKYIEEIEDRERQKQKYIEECECQKTALQYQIVSLEVLSTKRLKKVCLLMTLLILLITIATYIFFL